MGRRRRHRVARRAGGDAGAQHDRHAAGAAERAAVLGSGRDAACGGSEAEGMKKRILLGAKVLLRSRSLGFTREYFKRDGEGALRTYDWNGKPVTYRSGTSDAGLIYNILVRRGRKAEYAMPPEARLMPGNVRTVLDIGANIGIAALYFARAFPNATIHCFEPEPRNCDVLEANARTCERIRVHRFALGAEDGELRLYDSDDAANLGGFSAHSLGVNR